MSSFLPASSDEYVFGDSSCRPPGDGQENASSSAESDAIYRQYKQYHVGHVEKCSGSKYKEQSYEHQTCCKMKRTVLADQSFQSEPSKHALLPLSSSLYLQWARDLHELLDDCQGLELFKRFLAHEKCHTHSLDFWLAVRGLKNNMYDHAQLEKAIKAIYKRFIKALLVKLNIPTKDEICKKINNKKELNASIFDKACNELEEAVLYNLYLNFLKSDLYLEYVQKMQNGPAPGDSCRQSESSGSNSSTGSRERLDIMPTVPEDCEVQVNYKTYSCAPSLQVPNDNHKHRLRTHSSDSLKFNNNSRYVTSSKSRYSNSPYAKYSSYLPPSAQDSDRQSLSSGAHTDDAMSELDVAVKPHRSYERSMRKNAHLNSESNECQPIIPRTQRPQVERYSEATQNPDLFASKLITKLNLLKVQTESKEEAHERLIDRLKKIDDDDNPDNMKGFEGIPSQLVTATIQGKMDLCVTNESDQSILDQHVSRIWNDSQHQTPSNASPGQYSPPLRSRSPPLAERQKHHHNAPFSVNNNSSGFPGFLRPRSSDLHNPPQLNSKMASYTHRHKRERDTYSNDSGTVRDYTSDLSSDMTKQYYTAPFDLQKDQQCQMGNRRPRDGPLGSRRANLKKFSESCSSCVDSGVSVCDPPNPTVRDKVTSWLTNEKYSCAHGPNSDKDSSSHHKKSTHSSYLHLRHLN